MGTRLIAEVLDSAPDGLTAADRLVLFLLAEQARDETRVAYPGEDVLLRRSGMATASLRRAIKNLCDAGAVERVVVGQDRHGRPLYACRGQRAAYRLRQLVRKTLTGETLPGDGGAPSDPGKALTGETLPAEKGARPRAERRSPVSGKALTGDTPIRQYPSLNRQIRARADDERSAVQAALLDRTGRTIDEEHADAVARQILDASRGQIRAPARYLRRAIEQDPDPSRFLPTPSPPRYVRHA